MEESNSSYKKLFSNTLIIALGSFSSKVLMILLNAFYARYLSDAELGINDVIQQISNWLVPVFTFEIFEAVIRFGLDKQTDSRKVFTVGNAVCLGGFAALGIILPIVDASGAADKYLNGYSLLIYFFIVAASMQMVYSYFLRALEKMRLFSISVIFNTVVTLAGTILFIVMLRLGNRGYLYSIILGNLLTVLFMFFAGRLWEYLSPSYFDRALMKKMFAYSLPLIPAQLMWLVTNSSDTFMMTHFKGNAATGILSQSYKIANIVSTVYLMFGQAWNMSAVLEDDSEDRDEFYGNVFHLNQCMMYILVAGCLLLCKPITLIWMGRDKLVTATYAPILIYSTVFSCFTTFMGSIYLASGKTARSLVTSVIAGVINVSLNLVLIPSIGLFGPPISTVVSFLAVFIVRIFDSRSIVPFRIGIGKLIYNNIILAAMTVVSVLMNTNPSFEKPAFLLLPLMFVIILVLNIRPVWRAAMKLAPAKVVGIVERLGIVKIIILAVLAAAFAAVCFVWHTVLTVCCMVGFAGLMAFGIAADKRLFRLAGITGLFFTVFGAFGLKTAFGAILVLSAMEYIREPDNIVTFIGAVCLTGTLGSILGVWVGVLTGDLLLLIAAFACMGRIRSALGRVFAPAGRRQAVEEESEKEDSKSNKDSGSGSDIESEITDSNTDNAEATGSAGEKEAKKNKSEKEDISSSKEDSEGKGEKSENADSTPDNDNSDENNKTEDISENKSEGDN